MIIRYLLRINTEKHPDIQVKLEQQKGKDGVAIYLRRLIEQDIAQSKVSIPVAFTQPATKEVAASSEMSWPEVQIQSKPEKPKKEIAQLTDISDDFFGGMV
jgi:hypothetical protein